MSSKLSQLRFYLCPKNVANETIFLTIAALHQFIFAVSGVKLGYNNCSGPAILVRYNRVDLFKDQFDFKIYSL
jgi:hypothetical protein